MQWFAGGTALAAAMLLSAPCASQTQSEYAIVIGGLRVGALTVDQTLSDGGYRHVIAVRTTGLAGLVRQVSYDAVAEGTMSQAGLPAPARYVEFTDTGRRTSEADLIYRGGLPIVRHLSTEGRGASTPPVDPARAIGAVDPASVLGLLLSDRPAELACTFDAKVFDGWRLTHVSLSGEAGGANRCTGVFRRIAGFDPGDMAEGAEFAISVILSPRDGAIVRTEEVIFETPLGKGKLKRR
jgi:hypothetical protein